MPRDRQLTQTILNLSTNAPAVSQWMELTGFSSCVVTVRLTCTANVTAGTLTINGTNFVPQDAPSATSGMNKMIELNQEPATFAYSSTTGVLTLTTGATGTFVTNLGMIEGQFPQFIAANFAAGAGGGTFNLQVIVAGW